MAKYVIEDTTLIGIAESIRDKTGEVNKIKPTEMSTKVNNVYDAGRKAEYDAFWDAFQNYGNRTDYINAFARSGWTEANFRPKYNILGTTFSGCFAETKAEIDLQKRLEEQGISLDTSLATNVDSMFNGSKFTRIGRIDLRNCTTVRYAFAAMTLCCIIDLIILKDDGSQDLSTSFMSTNSLLELRFEGTIGKNTNLQWSSNLSHDSLMSIINCLQDKSGDTSGTLWTVTLGDTNIAKLTPEEQQIAYDKGWVLG